MILVCSQPEVEFRYPIDIEYTISKEKVELGDTIDVNLKVTLKINDENYYDKFKYVLLNPNNKFVYALIQWNTPPEQMKNSLSSIKEKYKYSRNWIVLSSDNDRIIDFQNRIIDFSLKIKIIKLRNSHYMRFPISFFKFDMIEDYGGYTNYINSENETRVQHDYDNFYLEIDISNPNIVTYNDSIPKEIIGEDPIEFEILSPGIVTEEFFNKEDKTK